MPDNTPGKLLQGDTALVTGGAAGIGKATAIALAREGARVVLSDVVADTGRAVADMLVKEGHDARFIESDLSTRDEPARLLDQALAALGKISVFVHSASPPRRAQDTMMHVEDETWDRLVAVNLTAGFKLGRDIGRHMVETGT